MALVLPSPPLGPGTSWTGNGCLSLTPRNAQSGPKTGADGVAGTEGGGCKAVQAKCTKVEGQTRSATDDDAEDRFFTLFRLMSHFF